MSKPKRVKHSLIVTNQRHHVFIPSCKCGNWRGVSARDRAGAQSQYRDHVGSVEQAERASKRRGGIAPMPRRTTSDDRLPPALSDG